MDTLGKGTIHVPGETERSGERFHHTTQYSMQFKTHQLFLYEIFHIIFLDHSWPQLTETAESETTDKGTLLYIININVYSQEGQFFFFKERHLLLIHMTDDLDLGASQYTAY